MKKMTDFYSDNHDAAQDFLAKLLNKISEFGTWEFGTWETVQGDWRITFGDASKVYFHVGPTAWGPVVVFKAWVGAPVRKAYDSCMKHVELTIGASGYGPDEWADVYTEMKVVNRAVYNQSAQLERAVVILKLYTALARSHSIEKQHRK